nr:hypothetical protein [Tanacetum cinerariifolium]
MSSNDNEITEVKVLMALADDEKVVISKQSAKNEPVSGPKTIKSILKSNSTFKVEALKGVAINELSSAPAKAKASASKLTQLLLLLHAILKTGPLLLKDISKLPMKSFVEEFQTLTSFMSLDVHFTSIIIKIIYGSLMKKLRMVIFLDTVAEESVIATGGSVVLTCDSVGRIIPISRFGKINPSTSDNQGRSTPGIDTFMSLAEDFTKTKSVYLELEGSSLS